jgi:hypothetical protein
MRRELILPGMLFTDEDFRALIMQQHLSIYDSEEEDDDGHWMRIPEFHVSDGVPQN